MAKLEIEVSQDLVEHSLKHAAEHMAEEIKLPGFREGKVPADLALQHLGHEAVFEHAFDESVGAWYGTALAEARISPIGSPSLAGPPAYEQGKPLTIELEVPVRPPAELGDFEGVEVGKKEPVPDLTAVDAELEVIRDRFSTLGDVDRAIELGDFADIDFLGKLDGEPFEGGAGSDHVLEIGSGQFIPGFEEQLIGKQAGDEVEVNVTFPDPYQAEHLAGKAVVFEVKVNAVKQKELPELTDKFAEENLGYDTLEDLRKEISASVVEHAEQEAERQFRWAVVDAVAKDAKIEVPKGHIHARAHELWQELAMSLSRRGIDPREYLQAMGKGEHEFIEGAEDDAELTIRRESTISQVIDQFGIEVSEDDIVDAIEEDMGEGREKAQEQLEVIKEAGGLFQVTQEIKGRLAIDYLVGKAKPIPFDQAVAREAIWTPEKGETEGAAQKPDAEGGLWTPGS